VHRDVLADFKVVSSFLIRRLTVAAPGSWIDCCSSLVGPAWAAPSSGRAGLRSGEDGSRWPAFSRLYFLGNDGNWQFLLAFLIMDLKHVIYIFL
jgi:hypothetical protein